MSQRILICKLITLLVAGISSNLIFTNSVMSPSFRFVAGQFFYLGQDNDLIGTMRVGTYF